MEAAEKVLEEAEVTFEVRVMSAHREPDVVADYCRNARMRGLRVIIAGAGLSAALPGRRRRAHRPAGHRRAAHEPPAPRSAGSTRCCPSRRCRPACPVACVGLDNARNAAHLAVRILAPR